MCVLQKYRSLGTCREDSFPPPNTISLAVSLALCSVFLSLGELTLLSIVPTVEFLLFFEHLHGMLYKRFFVLRTFYWQYWEHGRNYLLLCIFSEIRLVGLNSIFFFNNIYIIYYYKGYYRCCIIRKTFNVFQYLGYFFSTHFIPYAYCCIPFSPLQMNTTESLFIFLSRDIVINYHYCSSLASVITC